MHYSTILELNSYRRSAPLTANEAEVVPRPTLSYFAWGCFREFFKASLPAYHVCMADFALLATACSGSSVPNGAKRYFSATVLVAVPSVVLPPRLLLP